MAKVRDIGQGAKKSILREQLVTVGDLEDFKADILTAIKHLASGNKPTNEMKWLKSYEVKKLLRISGGTLQHLRSTGALPYTRIGGIIYYSMQDIDSMLSQKKR